MARHHLDCPCCDPKAPEHAIWHVTDGTTGDVFKVQVPHAVRHQRMGWGAAPYLEWTGEDGKPYAGVEDVRGPKGVTAIDEEGRIHRLAHGKYTARDHSDKATIDGAELQRMAKASGSDYRDEDATIHQHHGTPAPDAGARIGPPEDLEARRRQGPGSAQLFEVLSKAYGPLKPGQRFITVHPRGPGTEGNVILISPNHDGTFRVVGGAGGKMNHLRLKNVKTPEEYAKQGKGPEIDGVKEKKKQKRAMMSAEDLSKESHAKKEIERAKKTAERSFIEKVRSKVGGVSEDLNEDALAEAGLSDGAKNVLKGRHHRKQLREAVAKRNELAQKLVNDTNEGQIESAMLTHSIEETPALATTARDLAEQDLHAQAIDDKERRDERVLRQGRVTSGDAQVGKKAAEAIVAKIDKTDIDTDAVLKSHGGRDDVSPTGDKAPALRFSLLPSEELDRRAAQSLQDAKILASASRGEAQDDPVAKHVVAQALKRAGIEDIASEDPADVKDALVAEAARSQRKFELQQARSKTFQGMEADEGEAKASRALAFTDLLGGIAKSAKSAKDLGLTETERTPLQEPEIAAIEDILKDAQDLRTKQKAFRDMNKEVERGAYDQSRRAFDIATGEPPAEAVASIEDEVRRDLAERLAGMASPTRSVQLQALSGGHFDALADVGLGIAGQRYLDRPTVDALGVGNAAILMRHAMTADGHDTQAVLEALEAHHVESQAKVSQDALARAEAYVPGLTAKMHDVNDIETALSQLDAHHEDVNDAQRAVGGALGRLEGIATLGQAFRDGEPDKLTISTKTGGTEANLQWLHAIGLTSEDYAIDGGNNQITIPKSSWDKLINRAPQEEVDRRALVSAIKAGKHDEEGYLPAGIVRRSESSFTAPTPDAPTYHVPLDLRGDDPKGALADHVGSRLADGEHPADILHDVLAPVNVQSAADPEAYVQHVRDLFPMVDEAGQATKYEDQHAHFNGVAADFMRRKYGDEAGAFHAQDLRVDDPNTREALFRTLAAHPNAAAAFAPTGQLTGDQARSLRDHFYGRQGFGDKKQADVAAFHTAMGELGPEPSAEPVRNWLMGDSGPSPERQDWERNRDGVLRAHPREGLAQAIEAAAGDPEKIAAAKEAAANVPTPWERFVEAHGSVELAQRAVQDEMRSAILPTFREHYGKLTGRGLKTGVAEITNRERHVKATAGKAEADKLRADANAAYANLRKRQGGAFAGEGEGAVKQKYTNWLERETIDKQNQGGLFSAQQVEPKAERIPGVGERWSIGERAENQLASLLPAASAQFERGKKVGLFGGLNMDGERATQQRVVKMMGIKGGGRVGGFLGTGSGKSLTSIGAFTDRHAAGEAKHGLYLVPSAVQDQFGGEMLRYTEPGKYRWSTGAGKGHAERVAMLQDPRNHMRVMTHQSFRDTALKLMADHHGRSEEQMREEFGKADPKTRADWMRSAFDANDIPRHFVYVDEAHMATQRQGQDPSGVHAMMQAASHPTNATHALLGTATPVKNDESELHSMAAMIDPKKYGDRHQFMQNYGKDLAFNPHAIRRELDHVTYSAKIDPEGVDRTTTDNPELHAGREASIFSPGEPARKVAHGGPIVLTGEHKARADRVTEIYDRARKAGRTGNVDVEAIKELSPTAFAGQPESTHDAIARKQLDSLGIIKEGAYRKAINQAPPEINQKLQRMSTVIKHDVEQGEWTDRQGQTQKGKPSIVFTNSREEAEMIHKHLESQGLRSGLYHGAMTGPEREDLRLGFSPEKGDRPKYDVAVMTSAGEAGINMQRGKVLHHYDVPQTDKSHAQRTGRAYRQGQQGDVDVHNWYTDHPFEQSALRRLRNKAALGAVFQSPVAHLDETGIAGAYHQALAHREQHREVG